MRWCTADAYGPLRGVVSLLQGASLDDLKIAASDQVKRLKGLDIGDWELPQARYSRAMAAHFEEELEQARSLWPGVRLSDMGEIRLSTQKDAEMKAAKRLGLSSFDTSVLAVKLWGHGLTDERNRLLAALESEGTSPRTLQARRAM